MCDEDRDKEGGRLGDYMERDACREKPGDLSHDGGKNGKGGAASGQYRGRGGDGRGERGAEDLTAVPHAPGAVHKAVSWKEAARRRAQERR